MPGSTNRVGGAQVIRACATTAQPVGPTAARFSPPDINIVPTPALISETRTRISRVAGWDSTDISWSSDVDFTSYQFRVVANAADPVTSGVLLEQDQNPANGGSAGATYVSTITDAEVEAVSPAEGGKLIKLFLHTAGGWSS